jgi:hypothetical protein
MHILRVNRPGESGDEWAASSPARLRHLRTQHATEPPILDSSANPFSGGEGDFTPEVVAEEISVWRDLRHEVAVGVKPALRAGDWRRRATNGDTQAGRPAPITQRYRTGLLRTQRGLETVLCHLRVVVAIHAGEPPGR